MTGKRRVLTAFFAALFLLAVALSFVFIVHESEHDCSGEDCPVCAVVAVCQNTLKTLSGAFAVVAAAAAAVCFAVVLAIAIKAGLHSKTPVSLKVKLLY